MIELSVANYSKGDDPYANGSASLRQVIEENINHVF